MKCPICKTEIEFDIETLDEVYYDCSHCDSALLFKKGECKIINKGVIKEPSKKTLTENETLERDNEEQDSTTKSLTEKTYSELSVSTENTQKRTREEKETYQEQKSSIELQGEEPSALEEVSLEDDKFFPDETTQVPELNHSEEDELSEFEAEQKEVIFTEAAVRESEETPAIKNIEENSSDENLSTKDFIFEKEFEKSSFKIQKADLSQTESQSQKPESFADVAEFGNTQDQDRKGPFLYDLTLSEINSQVVREQILSLLDDEFLNLSIQKEDLKEGRLVIVKISPVQAYIIVTALMGLPLHISWTQHHIADS